VYSQADVDGPSFDNFGGYLFYNATTTPAPLSVFAVPTVCANVTVNAL